LSRLSAATSPRRCRALREEIVRTLAGETISDEARATTERLIGGAA